MTSHAEPWESSSPGAADERRTTQASKAQRPTLELRKSANGALHAPPAWLHRTLSLVHPESTQVQIQQTQKANEGLGIARDCCGAARFGPREDRLLNGCDASIVYRARIVDQRLEGRPEIEEVRWGAEFVARTPRLSKRRGGDSNPILWESNGWDQVGSIHLCTIASERSQRPRAKAGTSACGDGGLRGTKRSK
jgi:hypothetical protein